MKKIICSIAFVTILINSNAQLCPGGGSTFSSAVGFNLSWIMYCSTGTSCSGGTTFDNRAACEPVTSMDSCAPAPSCGNFSKMASDLWFKFYATSTTSVIDVTQNVSFYASIQAFSGGPSCGSLTEIGCIVASGPSQGVSLNLTGLTVGNLYYFRVFGTANNASQRTGSFCFCGSTGISSDFVTLPIKLLSLHSVVSDKLVTLTWTTANPVNLSHIDIERSNNKTDFNTIGTRLANNPGALKNQYTFEDFSAIPGNNFYRLKMVAADGSFTYSNIIETKLADDNSVHIYPNILEKGQFFKVLSNGITGKLDIRITGLKGQILKRQSTNAGGETIIETSGLEAGTYIVSVTSPRGESHYKMIIK